MTGIYSLYIDPYAPTDVRVAIYDFVRADKKISGWWNHLPGLYLLDTTYNAAELTEILKKHVKPWSFLVMRVSLDDLQGWMPERGWEWITTREGRSEDRAAEREREKAEI